MADKVFKNPLDAAQAITKPSLNDIVGQWASEGFDESKKPWAGSGGKGVFHQGRFDYQFADDEDFSKPIETSFDFGSASKAKSIAELNNRIKDLGISARVGYPDDDSGNDKIYFEKLKAGFTPTKETIWNDPKHPLYGIGPEEQNIEYLQSAIDEIGRKTQSPAHWRFYGGASGGGTRLDAIKKANQYKKALAYIKSFGGK